MASAPFAHSLKVANENWTNFSVLRHRPFDGFLVTSKNSGTHWVKYMLSVALAHAYEIDPPEYFSENATRPYISWPKDPVTHPVLPRLAFSHTIPHQFLDWGWARGAAGLPPYALCVRHPMSILASHHAKWEYDIQVDWLTYLKGDPSGGTYRCDLYWLARFWNRWGDVEARYPESITRVHYEETLADPEATLRRILTHWSLELPDEAIAAALKAGTKDEMEKRTDPNAEPNVLQRRKQSLEELFSCEALEIYTNLTTRLFRHNLGYDLLTPPTR